jgi:organic hydroperoxide reductase OsmC/OhrA
MADVYRASLSWTGSTGAGWEAYDRRHMAAGAEPGQEVRLTSGEHQTDPTLLNPEQLVALGAASCQMLSFLHVAAKSRVDVVEYEDEPQVVMGDKAIAEIVLSPRIVMTGAVNEAKVMRLVSIAHRYCYVARSLSCPVRVAPVLVASAA